MIPQPSSHGFIRQSLTDGMAFLFAEAGVDLAPRLKAQLIHSRMLPQIVASGRITKREAGRQADAAIEKMRSSYQDFEVALPFILALSMVFLGNWALVDLDEFLEMCRATLEHADFTAGMRTALAEYKRQHATGQGESKR